MNAWGGKFMSEKIHQSNQARKHPCPLCKQDDGLFFDADEDRSYYRCPVCKLIFVDREDLLTPEEEKERYDKHENDFQDMGYRRFLWQMAQPLIERLGPPPLTGLDFGSGPTPVLAVMLASKGYHMSVYDPFYAPDKAVLNGTYDFITCSETIEHFCDPAEEWSLLLRLLRPGGWLGVMTKLVEDPRQFMQLHYKQDMTHVCFYSSSTFNFLAQRDGLMMTFIDDRVILVRKPK
jgi:SAM-dependent methyltransferase